MSASIYSSRLCNRPSFADMPINAALRWASSSHCSRSKVRQWMPLGFTPLPLKMPGTQPSRRQIVSEHGVASDQFSRL